MSGADWITQEEINELRYEAEAGRTFRQLYMQDWPNQGVQCDMRAGRFHQEQRCPNAAEFRVQHVDRADHEAQVCGDCLLPAVRMARADVVVSKLSR